ncbi:ribosomal 40S subunit protein S10A [Dionaea muscipula]
MATSSISSTVFASLPFFNSSRIPSKPEVSALSSFVSNHKPLRISQHSSKRIFAVPEVLSNEDTIESSAEEVVPSEIPASSTISIGSDLEKNSRKPKIRIKLRSYWVPLIEDSCKQIMDAARRTNARTMGPVPLPTKKRIYCVLKSPHVHKDARFHFEIRTHQRLIDIHDPTAQTIDSLMHLDLPAGVDVEVKL